MGRSRHSCRRTLRPLRRLRRQNRPSPLPFQTPRPRVEPFLALLRSHGSSRTRAFAYLGSAVDFLASNKGENFYSENGHENGNDHLIDGENDVVEDEEKEDADDDDDDDEENRYGKSRSINYILRRPSVVSRLSGVISEGRKRVRPEEEEKGTTGRRFAERDGEVAVEGVELALGIRRFAERVTRMEKRRMEMMQETERFRTEMEKRRIEMILDSQRKIVDAISASFRSNKRL